MGRAAATEAGPVTGGVVLGRAPPDEQAATTAEADTVHASSGRNRKLRENGGTAEVMDCSVYAARTACGGPSAGATANL